MFDERVFRLYFAFFTSLVNKIKQIAILGNYSTDPAEVSLALLQGYNART
jgi:hypothetical protein